ncbi:hypothetical protein REPUB_Repub12eG0017900 [Reevesia pubescens]
MEEKLCVEQIKPNMGNLFSSYHQTELSNQTSAPGQPPTLCHFPPPACPPVHSFPSRPSKPLMPKNRLHEFTYRSSIPLPVYQTFNVGSQKFRSTVVVDGICYTSGSTFPNKKAAEQDIAKYALECISKKLKDEGCHIIREDTVFCKSVLYEFAVKMNLEMPTYNTIQSEGLLPIFVSKLVFNGVTYSGETGTNKKEAEQLAARAAILSLIEDPRDGTFLSQIIKSKAKLYVALNKVKDSSIFHLGTTHAGANTLIHNNKEVETVAVIDSVSTNASLQASSGAEHPHHAFKIPNSKQGPECIDLPFAFVPPVVGQASDGGETSSRKQRKKKG